MKTTEATSLYIYTLGNFSIALNGEVLRFQSKVPKKPLTFLKVLIAFGGFNINVEKIAYILWPGLGRDAALQSFYTTLNRLRKILGKHKLILLQENKISLNSDLIWLDLWEFNYFYYLATKPISLTQTSENTQKQALQAIHCYQGQFLDNEPEDNWLLDRRIQIQKQLKRLHQQIKN